MLVSALSSLRSTELSPPIKEVMMRPQRPLELLITSLLFNPELAQSLHERPDELRASFKLSSEELSWLLAIDPRRWRADLERPHRALEGLLLHLPVSVALSTLNGGSAEAYLGFFKSPQLRQSLEERALLAEGFCAWLRAQSARPWSPMRVALSSLELAIAELNSEERRPEATGALSGPERLDLSPRVRLIRAPHGALELYSELSRALHSLEPLAALSRPRLASLSELLELHESAAQRLSAGLETPTIIAQLIRGEVGLSEAPQALAELLWAAREQLSYQSSLGLLASYGLERSEAHELLIELQSEDLISLS